MDGRLLVRLIPFGIGGMNGIEQREHGVPANASWNRNPDANRATINKVFGTHDAVELRASAARGELQVGRIGIFVEKGEGGDDARIKTRVVDFRTLDARVFRPDARVDQEVFHVMLGAVTKLPLDDLQRAIHMKDWRGFRGSPRCGKESPLFDASVAGPQASLRHRDADAI